MIKSRQVAGWLLLFGMLAAPAGAAETEVVTRGGAAGTSMIVRVLPGESWNQPFTMGEFKGTATPQMAVWAEDAEGRFLETLFVTDKSALQSWRGTYPERRDDATFRKAALPHWLHKRAAAGRPMPTKVAPLTDAVSGATPPAGLVLRTRLQAPGGKAAILVEINNAFDENASYPMKGNDVGADYNGQPSIVYRAVVDLGKPGISLSAFHGRGSWTGSDGSLAPAAEGLTTALKIVREVQVTVE